MAEIVRAQGTSSGDVDEDGEPDEEAASSKSSAAPADELPRVTYVDAVRAAPEICATLLFLIADAQPDAAEMAKRIRPPVLRHLWGGKVVNMDWLQVHHGPAG